VESSDRSVCVPTLSVATIGSQEVGVHLRTSRVDVAKLVDGQSGELTKNVRGQITLEERARRNARGGFGRP